MSDFRTKARAWLAAHAPTPLTRLDENDIDGARTFQAALHDAGLAGITWPREWGGQGLTAAEQLAFNDEARAYELPAGPFIIGMGMCGPTLVDLGTDAQRARYLTPLLRGEEIWCQLFSEPGAGSDVASLQTRAVRDGEGWVLNGQKVWTSNAQFADYGAVLARTDPDKPKHHGLTMFVLDMRTPGVTVRPLVDMTGGSPFNEVYFDDVRMPGDAVIGEVDAGWHAAVTMLGHERMSISDLRQRRSVGLGFDALSGLARRQGTSTDPGVRGELAQLYAREQVRSLFNARVKQEIAAGRVPGPRGSVGKLTGALLLWRAIETAGELAGAGVVAWADDDADALSLARSINAAPASSIAGGTNDIQRGIIGERILGLPKEPQVDRGVPFRQLRVGTQNREVRDAADARA